MVLKTLNLKTHFFQVPCGNQLQSNFLDLGLKPIKLDRTFIKKNIEFILERVGHINEEILNPVISWKN